MLTKTKAKTMQKTFAKSAPNLSRVRETDNRNRIWINPDMVLKEILEELKYIADNTGQTKLEEKQVDSKDLLVMVADDSRPDSSYSEAEIKLGVQEELAHTNNVKIAKKIVKDHLDESNTYYSDLNNSEPNYYSKNKVE